MEQRVKRLVSREEKEVNGQLTSLETPKPPITSVLPRTQGLRGTFLSVGPLGELFFVDETGYCLYSITQRKL